MIQKVHHKKTGEESTTVNEEKAKEQRNFTVRNSLEFESSCARVSSFQQLTMSYQVKEPCLMTVLFQTIPCEKVKKKVGDNYEREMITEECIVDSSYICQFCGASFLTYFELKTHWKIHQDEKVIDL